MFTRSPIGVSSSRSASLSLSTCSDSPVSRDSSTRNSRLSLRRMSAGTAFPAVTMTMSPGTRSSASISRRFAVPDYRRLFLDDILERFRTYLRLVFLNGAESGIENKHRENKQSITPVLQGDRSNPGNQQHVDQWILKLLQGDDKNAVLLLFRKLVGAELLQSFPGVLFVRPSSAPLRRSIQSSKPRVCQMVSSLISITQSLSSDLTVATTGPPRGPRLPQTAENVLHSVRVRSARPLFDLVEADRRGHRGTR